MQLCATCHAGCCRSFAIPISGADVWRIEQQRGLDFWDFACRWADHDGTIARNHAPQFYFEDEPETPFVICLQHVESTHFPGSSRCQFLEETGPTDEHPLGVARCGIYEDRPFACRAFPTKLDASGDLAVIYDVPPRGRMSADPLYRLCPRPWTTSDIDPVQTIQDLIMASHEMTFFHKLARRWNQSCPPWAAFPEFLRTVYSQRVRVEHEHRAHPAARVA